MKLHPPTIETVKAKADRYYKAQCKRIADERKAREHYLIAARDALHKSVEAEISLAHVAREHAFVIAHNALHKVAVKRGRPRKVAAATNC